MRKCGVTSIQEKKKKDFVFDDLNIKQMKEWEELLRPAGRGYFSTCSFSFSSCSFGLCFQISFPGRCHFSLYFVLMKTSYSCPTWTGFNISNLAHFRFPFFFFFYLFQQTNMAVYGKEEVLCSLTRSFFFFFFLSTVFFYPIRGGGGASKN